MTEGILYTATATRIIEEAAESARTVKQHNDYPIAVVTTPEDKERMEDGDHVFDSVVVGDEIKDDFRDKLLNLHMSPFDQTLYLDPDTCVTGDISPIFEALASYDMAIAKHENVRAGGVEIEGVPECFKQIEGGVIGFNECEEFHNWLERSKELYEKQLNGDLHPELDEHTSPGVYHDIYPMTMALYQEDVEFISLPREYNFHGFCISSANEVRIIHLRNKEVPMLAEKINDRIEPRVYFTTQKKLSYYGGDEIILGAPVGDRFLTHPAFKYILQKTGLYPSAKRIYKKWITST